MAATRDPIGGRMKGRYEDQTRYLLPRRTWTIVRIDGKAFHTWTRACEKPFDRLLANAMDEAARHLCGEMMGCCGAYGQSDEYSFLMNDFETVNTEAWFDGNAQKIVSVAASVFTAFFNRCKVCDGREIAAFDARVFTIPDSGEVENYFIWRQGDCIRNAIQSAGQAYFSQNQLHGLNVHQITEKLFQERDVNLNDYPVWVKRGRVIWKETYEVPFPEWGGDGPGQTALRTRWTVDTDPPVFTTDREYLRNKIMRFVAAGKEAVT